MRKFSRILACDCFSISGLQLKMPLPGLVTILPIQSPENFQSRLQIDERSFVWWISVKCSPEISLRHYFYSIVSIPAYSVLINYNSWNVFIYSWRLFECKTIHVRKCEFFHQLNDQITYLKGDNFAKPSTKWTFHYHTKWKRKKKYKIKPTFEHNLLKSAKL